MIRDVYVVRKVRSVYIENYAVGTGQKIKAVSVANRGRFWKFQIELILVHGQIALENLHVELVLRRDIQTQIHLGPAVGRRA